MKVQKSKVHDMGEKILSLFLSIRIRESPANYQQIEESKFSILQMGRQLSKYKNELPQIWINDENIHWLYLAA